MSLTHQITVVLRAFTGIVERMLVRDRKADDAAVANMRSVVSTRRKSSLRRYKLYFLIQFNISDRHEISSPIYASNSFTGDPV